MIDFSPNAGALAESATLAITATAKRMRAEGVAVAPFGAGEPDFDTLDHIKEAAIAAIQTPSASKYGPAAGSAPLREAVAAHFSALGYEGLTGDRTIICAGAKGVLYFGLLVLLREGDEVLIPTPCWLSYPKMVQAAAGRSVFVPTNAADGFVIDPDRVRAAITPRTRVLLINSPGNPTGAVQPAEVQKELGRIAVEHDLAVISDEIYEHLTYEPARFQSFAALAPEARERALVVNGVSKAYAMTGWRIGYGGGPKEWIQRMIRLQSHALSGPPEICQRAALAALTGPHAEVEARRTIFRERRDVMHAALSEIPDLTVPLPQGAFYIFPDVSSYLGRTFEGRPIETSTKLAALLLDHAHAAVVPGEVFEAPDAVRFSYACSRADITSGVSRVKDFLTALA